MRSPGETGSVVGSDVSRGDGGSNCDDAVPRTPASLEVYLLGLVDFEESSNFSAGWSTTSASAAGPRSFSASTRRRSASAGRAAGPTSRPTTTSCARWGIQVHWVNRGGGCVLHLPGQLAAYVALPLEPARPRSASATSRACTGPARRPRRVRPAGLDPPGPAGRLPRAMRGSATVGVAVNRWIAYHGLTLNVGPYPRSVRRPRRAGPGPASCRSAQTSMESRRQRPAPMSRVREALIRRIGGGLRAGAAPRLHRPSPDPPEGPAHVYAPKPRMTAAEPAGPAARDAASTRPTPARRRLPEWLKRPIPAARRDRTSPRT